MYLFSKIKGVSVTAFRWIASEEEMCQYCGFLVVANLLREGGQMSQRFMSELKDQAAAAISGGKVLPSQAARAVMALLEREDGQE